MLNVFQGDAFSTVSLTRAINATPYVPSLLGMLGLFEPEPVSTATVAVERLGNTLALVPTSPRGAPPSQREKEKRTVRDVRTVRLALNSRIHAHEVSNLRAFGSETQVETLQGVALRRMQKLRQDIELTWEHLRLGAIQGVVKDADGTDLVDYYAFWGVSPPAPISFALSTGGTEVLTKCDAVMRAMQRNSEGAFLPTTRVIGLCGDAFWDSLVTHPKVEKYYLNRAAADVFLPGTAFRQFDFGGITFVNYRGTDDGTTVTIPADDCRFVPLGGRDVFQWVMSPMDEAEQWMNTLGQPVYALMIPDRERGFWVDVEVYSYVLPVVTRPRMLLRGTRT
ncbi:major capsid protein [Crenalkalicoccus roseus]|uniref:major capsid protein n=1 Tax=Crenalkalicoccus roseus TaxID=1485588 RepID=UPI0010821FD6|nr:major capsid protein [Crenalkalicoccus roseus]